MLKKMLLAILGVALVVGTIAFIKLGQFTAMGVATENMVPPPETVTAMTVEQAHWERSIAAIATVSAVQGVTVSAEAGGRVTGIHFESGSMVDAGDLLLQLDTASEDARLASARAAAALAKADFARVSKIGKQNLTSLKAVDSAEAAAKETVAQVADIRAQIAKKAIHAPFAGRLGLRLVNLGQILSEGDAIVSLQTLNPIHVDFSVPQQQILHLKPGLKVQVTADAAPAKVFSGEIIAVSPEVDTATRSVRVRALVDNPEEMLHAGMFANAEVILPGTQAVLPVVATAVLYAPFGDSVFIVEEPKDDSSGDTGRVLRQQFVRLGERHGDFVDVIDGLDSGETVVTSGVFKLRSGMNVVIDNTLAPRAELEPDPDDS